MHKAAAHAKRGLPLRHLPAMDLPFLMLVLTLVGFGLVMLGSASSAVALYRRGDAFAYLRPQLLYAALGIGAMWVASRVDYHVYHKLAWPLLALSMVLLTAVLFMPEYNAASAGWCCRAWAHCSPARSPNLRWCWCLRISLRSTTTAWAALRWGCCPLHWCWERWPCSCCWNRTSPAPCSFWASARCSCSWAAPAQVVRAGRGGRCSGHWSCHHHYAGPCATRPAVSAHGWILCRPLGDGHQTIQSLYAIGSGGAAGLGLGSSRQKHLFVPEPQNDFIFSILCEELGFVGACAVILLFALLLWRGITLAAHAPDRFGALLVVGFVVQVALQAVLNMAVVTNTIPNTGISLPFFSSGGTSLMMLLGEMGIVLSVSRGET